MGIVILVIREGSRASKGPSEAAMRVAVAVGWVSEAVERIFKNSWECVRYNREGIGNG